MVVFQGKGHMPGSCNQIATSVMGAGYIAGFKRKCFTYSAFGSLMCPLPRNYWWFRIPSVVTVVKICGDMYHSFSCLLSQYCHSSAFCNSCEVGELIYPPGGAALVIMIHRCYNLSDTLSFYTCRNCNFVTPTFGVKFKNPLSFDVAAVTPIPLPG